MTFLFYLCYNECKGGANMKKLSLNRFYIDRTKNKYQVLPYHIKQYYLAEKKMTNYS